MSTIDNAENPTELLPDIQILTSILSKVKIEACLLTASSKKVARFTKVFSKNFKRVHLQHVIYCKWLDPKSLDCKNKCMKVGKHIR